MDKRIIELALETLEARKAVLQAEIDKLTAEGASAVPATKKKRQRTMTAAQRKAVSVRMKRYWKARRAKKA